jgi:hypothetical protein
MADEMSKRTKDGLLYRSFTQWWLMAVYFGFVFLLLAGAALNPDAPWAGRIASAIGACAIAAAGVITRRSGIVVTSDGLMVRRFLGKETRLRWDQVDNVRLVYRNRVAYVTVEATDGRRLRTEGLTTRSEKSKSGARVVKEIEGHRPPHARYQPNRGATRNAITPEPAPVRTPSEREIQEARIKAVQADLARLRSSLDELPQSKHRGHRP